MIYVAAFIFGVATWMSNPIASGALVVLGFLIVASWAQERFITIANNQKKIWNHIIKR